MGTDWLIKVYCWKGLEKGKTEKDHINDCLNCPYVIWETPKSIAGIMRTMCGVRVGNVYRAAELDDIGKELTGNPYFTKTESKPSLKRDILEQIKNHAKRTGWSIKGFSTTETIDRLDILIEFCKRAEEKGLDIWAWA
jgi:hypothetical protein